MLSSSVLSHTASMSILVGGGTGFLGSCLINALQLRGYSPTKLISITRSPRNLQQLAWKDIETNGLPGSTKQKLTILDDTVAIFNFVGRNVSNITDNIADKINMGSKMDSRIQEGTSR